VSCAASTPPDDPKYAPRFASRILRVNRFSVPILFEHWCGARYYCFVRITVAHTKTKDEIKRIIDRSFDDFFRGFGAMPLQIVNEKRKWENDTLIFSFGAKISLVTSPITGTILVTDRDLTIDADFGLLEKLLPAAQAKASLESRVKGLLT
jgi:hypothetical protein